MSPAIDRAPRPLSPLPLLLGLGLGLAPAAAGLAQHDTLPAPASAGDDAYAPRVHEDDGQAREALGRLKLHEGFAASLWAAEPHLANPVCLYVDARGRVFVAETFRLHAGVTDMREHMDWLHDELAAQSVADRLAFMRAHEGDAYLDYAREHERIKRLVDSDGDGRADTSTVFADGFQDPAAGIAAGLLTHGDDVYYTCIPDLWRLTDADDDGVAEARESLSTGYGVKIALLGHDLHGLRLGPDGRLYFSVGDRGLSIHTEDGRHLHLPDRGSVLRCELDGSELEVYATGLRNPQELVFDDHGNLFTGDNNSDGGDQARWVYVVEGGDSGWRHHYQYVTRPNLRGPWNAELGWKPHHPGQPAFLVPPIANHLAGPSGLAVHPSGDWGEDWRGTFFLCDFRGGPQWSSIHAFENAPAGAGFALVDDRRFLWDGLPTDCDFGPDGALYVSDWVDGWGMTGRGRIFRVVPDPHPSEFSPSRPDPRTAQGEATARLLAEGMAERPVDELRALCRHDHRDVRQGAHLELAERAVGAPLGSDTLQACMRALLDLAHTSQDRPLGRLHGIWGVAIVARRRADLDGFAEVLLPLAEDADLEVRCQALRALGEVGDPRALPVVRRALLADDARERYFACEALGRLGEAEAAAGRAVADDAQALARVLLENGDRDPWLRHGAVRALERLGDRETVGALAHDADPAVRRGACVVLRRWRDPRVAELLGDEDPTLVAEAARAILEEPVDAALPALARALDGEHHGDRYLARRCLNANRVVHDAEARARVVRFLARPDVDPVVRAEGLEILGEWDAPSPVDRVTGIWRPVEPGPRTTWDDGLAALGQGGADLARSADPEVARAWIALLRGLPDPGPSAEERAALAAVAADPARDAGVSARALEALLEREGDGARTRELLASAVEDPRSAVRSVALGALARRDPAQGLPPLFAGLDSDRPAVARDAAAVLVGLDRPEVRERLAAVLDHPTHPGFVAVLEAAGDASEGPLAEARRRWEASVAADPARGWTPALAVGDAAAGRRVFLEDVAVGCLRCHKLGDQGSSEVGPDLTGVGARLDREALLRSVVDPNAELAEGYESWIFLRDDGTLVVGRVLSEADGTLRVLDADGETHEIPVERVEARRRDVSAMPTDLAPKLSPRALRDLVTFLAEQR